MLFHFHCGTCRLNDQIFLQSQTCISCSMHFNYISIIGDVQQTTCTCILLVWKLKHLWKITKEVPWCCKRDWTHSLLQSMHCILFILHMHGLIRWLTEILLRVNVIQVRKLKEHQMNIVSNSTTKTVLLVMKLSFHYELWCCIVWTLSSPYFLAKWNIWGRMDSYKVNLYTG